MAKILRHKYLAYPLTALSLATSPALGGEWDLSGSTSFELRTFLEKSPVPRTLDHFQPSLSLEGDIRWSSDDGNLDMVFVPFLRIDSRDDRRTHSDIREAYIRYSQDDLTLRTGLAKVFWGVAESRHLVDIVNQSDTVEDIDEEDKFGQTMVELEYSPSWGTLTLWWLPDFRGRSFPGLNGRLRSPLLVADDNYYTANSDDAQLGNISQNRSGEDFALRYSHYIGDIDFGLSFFKGTSREARLIPDVTGLLPPKNGTPQLLAVYDDITQYGLDIQWTIDAWLLKFEGIIRDTPFETFTAFVGGFEYTLYGISETGADLGLLAEFQYDGRSGNFLEAPLTIANQDLFIGTRYAFNDAQDSAILAGFVTDLGNGSTASIIEASTRLGQSWILEIEGRLFPWASDRDALNLFEDDSHINIRLTRYF